MENVDNHKRPTWDEYFMEIANSVAKRSTCDRGRVGCVIAKNKQILTTGYAGAPKGMAHCDEVGHQIKATTHEDGTITQHCLRTTHAEQNAIAQAAKLGVAIDGATIYCRMTPCYACAKMIVNAGVVRVVCERRYLASKDTQELFQQAGIELEHHEDKVLEYTKQ